MQTATCNILTDPMYSERAGPFNVLGPRRVRQPAVALEDLPPISHVLLSHNHYDHCDLATLQKLAKRSDPIVVTPLGNASLVQSAGIRRVVELDWWQHADAWGPINFAMIPIGAYEPRWFMGSVHMNPAEAVQAHIDLMSAMSIGMHFGTFQLTTEGIDDPPLVLGQALEQHGIPSSEFRVPSHGESFHVY